VCTLIRKVRIYFVFRFVYCSQRRCWSIEIFCMFCHFCNVFAILSEATMSYCFHRGMLLLFFDNLGTVLPRLSIKLTTVVTIPIGVKLTQHLHSLLLVLMTQSLMPFLRQICHGSKISRLTLTVFIFDHQRLVW